MGLAGLIHLVVASMSSIPIVKSVGTDNPSLTEKTAAFVWNTSYVVRDRAFWQFYGSDTLSVRTALGCMRTLAPNMIFVPHALLNSYLATGQQGVSIDEQEVRVIRGMSETASVPTGEDAAKEYHSDGSTPSSDKIGGPGSLFSGGVSVVPNRVAIGTGDTVLLGGIEGKQIAPSEVSESFAAGDLSGRQEVLVPSEIGEAPVIPSPERQVETLEDSACDEILNTISENAVQRPKYDADQLETFVYFNEQGLQNLTLITKNHDYDKGGSLRLAIFDLSDLELIETIAVTALRAPPDKRVFILIDKGQYKDIQLSRPRVWQAVRRLQSTKNLQMKQCGGRSPTLMGRMHMKMACSRLEVLIGSHNYTKPARMLNWEVTVHMKCSTPLGHQVIACCVKQFNLMWSLEDAEAVMFTLDGIVAMLPNPSELDEMSEKGTVVGDKSLKSKHVPVLPFIVEEEVGFGAEADGRSGGSGSKTTSSGRVVVGAGNLAEGLAELLGEDWLAANRAPENATKPIVFDCNIGLAQLLKTLDAPRHIYDQKGSSTPTLSGGADFKNHALNGCIGIKHHPVGREVVVGQKPNRSSLLIACKLWNRS